MQILYSKTVKTFIPFTNKKVEYQELTFLNHFSYLKVLFAINLKQISRKENKSFVT